MNPYKITARFCATLSALLFTGAAWAQAPQPAQTTQASAPGNPTAQQRTAARKQMATQFGFTPAQSDIAIQKMTTILKSYTPRFAALQKKYTPTTKAGLTAQQRTALQKEVIDITVAASKETDAALLSIATPEQLPRVKLRIAAQQRQIDQMRKASGPMPRQ